MSVFVDPDNIAEDVIREIGSIFGLFFILLGGAFTCLVLDSLEGLGATLNIFTAGPGLISLGIAFFFPGGNVSAKEILRKEKPPV